MKKRRIDSFILALTALIILIPVLNIVIWAFTARWAWPALLPQRFSARGLEEILHRGKETGQLLLSSVSISLITAILSVLVGTMSARALVFYEFRGKGLVQFLCMLPFFIPATVFVMGVQILFIRLHLAGTAAGVILVHLICSLPYAVRLISDGMQASGLRLEEQARVLGASPFSAFWHAGIPAIRPVLFSALGMSYIVSFSQYFLTLIIGGGKVRTFTIVMVPYLQNGSRDIACIYSLIFTGISLLIFMLFSQAAKRLGAQTEGGLYADE